MSGVLSKIGEIIGFKSDDEFDDDEEMLMTEQEEESNVVETPFSRKNNKVVNIHTATSAKIMITRPTDFEDAVEICDSVKNRKIVVINTTALDHSTAQRLIDFISGAAHVLDGDLQEIEKEVYVLTPSTVQVTNELKNELSNKGLFNWNNKNNI